MIEDVVNVDYDVEHWDELQRLFDDLAGVPLAQRAARLRSLCPDEVLGARVLALLVAADGLDERTADPSADTAVAAAEEHIGSYRLISRIGAGGSGAVYLAERWVEGVALRSALKILAPHAASAGFVERFRREQQFLAALDHPNITRLLDVGWSDGARPYLVMEYVEGTDIVTFCDSRALGIAERVALLLTVCDAVSHAHRNLILHLDLKPSNILVSSGGTVKLLDFGTSRLIRMQADSTATLMATPAFASPEQLLDRPVSTASDVYGLGATLFALLAGRAPFGDSSAGMRIEAAARAQEPPTLTRAVVAGMPQRIGLSAARLGQALRGDLTAIAAACLRAAPMERYSSVEMLSEDLRRYLTGRPVNARRQTLTYRAAKFVGRHRVSAATAAAVVSIVIASFAFAWTQQRRALADAERSVRMQTFLFGVFKMANPNYTAKPVATVPEFLRVGLQKLPDFIHDPADLRAGQLALAESMYESGDLENARAALRDIMTSAAGSRAVGDETEAEAFAGQIDFQRGDIGAGRRMARHALSISRGTGVGARARLLAETFYAYNEDDNGFFADENLAMLRSAFEEAQARRLPARDTALILYYLASDLYQRGRGLEAKPLFEKLLRLYQADPFSLCGRSEVYGWLAWITHTNGDSAGSLPLFRQAYEGYVTCSGADSRGALDELPYWSDALVRLGRAPEAVRMLEDALPIWRRVLGETPSQSEMLYFLGRAYVATGRYGAAEQTAAEFLHRLEGKLAPDDRNIGTANLVLGEALAGQRRFDEARPHAEIAQRLLVASAVSVYGHQLGEEANRLMRQVDAGR